MIKKIFYLPGIILLLLASCTSSSDSLTESLRKTDEEFSIQYGHKIVLNELGLIIHFLDIAEDSRCPVGLYCIWAGNAKIIANINHQKLDFNTYLDPSEHRVRSNYRIKLLKLEPYPVHGETTQKEDYKATFILLKAKS